MIYKGLNRIGEIETVKAHGGADVAEVYGGINESNPIYYKTRTLTGTLPLSYKALGKSLSDYLISGNTVQDGTPAPDAPVDVVGCGVRTENLFDYSDLENGSIYPTDGSNYDNPTQQRTKSYIPVIGGESYCLSNITARVHQYKQDKTYLGSNLYSSVFTTDATCAYVRIAGISNNFNQNVMLNTGSTSKPYEPYGYKLPPTVNGIEYPIYLGQVPTTRRIRKIELTGEENWYKSNTEIADRAFFVTQVTSDSVIESAGLCTHFVHATVYTGTTDSGFLVISAGGLRIRTPDVATLSLDEFKQWLVAQYANGTPVTVWYVLATPTTGIVNEPLHKIGNYADTVSMAQAGVTIPTVAGANTLTIGTTVQPSAVSITGNIKEVST